MSLKTLTSLMVILGLATLTMGQCQNPPLFTTIPGANGYYNQNSFPITNLASSCILSACPALIGVCPVLSNGVVCTSNLNTAISALSACLQQNVPLCGVNMALIPMANFGWTTANLFPASLTNGTCYVTSGLSFLYNLPSATYTLNQVSNRVVNLCIDVTNLTTSAYYSCNFLFPNGSSLNTPNAHSLYHLNISATVSIDFNALLPTIKVLADQSHLNIVFSNFVDAQGKALDPNTVNLINQGMNNYLNNGDIANAATVFLATYLTLGLQAAQTTCP